jgi:hypothetical protein
MKRTRCQHVPAALITALALAGIGPAFSGLAAQAPVSQNPAGAYAGPRTADGKPDLNGIWQVFNSANWDIEAHSPEEGVPGGQGVVEGGHIPYQPWALAKKKENYEQRATADPASATGKSNSTLRARVPVT